MNKASGGDLPTIEDMYKDPNLCFEHTATTIENGLAQLYDKMTNEDVDELTKSETSFTYINLLYIRCKLHAMVLKLNALYPIKEDNK